MRDAEFQEWLEHEYVTRRGAPLVAPAQGDAISRCRRVERHEGDLDAHYLRDHMSNLLGKFRYPTDASMTGVEPTHSVPIAGNISNGTASLKSALLLYRRFLESRNTPFTRR